MLLAIRSRDTRLDMGLSTMLCGHCDKNIHDWDWDAVLRRHESALQAVERQRWIADWLSLHPGWRLTLVDYYNCQPYFPDEKWAQHSLPAGTIHRLCMGGSNALFLSQDGGCMIVDTDGDPTGPHWFDRLPAFTSSTWRPRDFGYVIVRDGRPEYCTFTYRGHSRGPVH
ncbi:MAG: hypothetical protein AB1758_05900 [Candidatus Eremiobacterota bacterium]